MHQLRFGSQMTEKLFRLAQKEPVAPVRGADFIRAIVWAPQSMAVPGKAGWLLTRIPKSHAEPERVFTVDGLSIYISANVEPLVRDQTFDWDDKRGVMSYAA
jgi:hypothetical protein